MSSIAFFLYICSLQIINNRCSKYLLGQDNWHPSWGVAEFSTNVTNDDSISSNWMQDDIRQMYDSISNQVSKFWQLIKNMRIIPLREVSPIRFTFTFLIKYPRIISIFSKLYSHWTISILILLNASIVLQNIFKLGRRQDLFIYVNNIMTYFL